MECIVENLNRDSAGLPQSPAPQCDTVGVVTGPTKLTRRLGARLKKVRKAKGLTQTQAADLLGITQPRWAQMEQGGVTNLTKLQAACRAIGARLIVDVQEE